MNGDRAFGITREQIRRQLAIDDGEPNERLDPAEPESHCVPCGWTGPRGGQCECHDGVPRC